MASVAPVHKDVDNIIGLNSRSDRLLIQEHVNQLQAKETRIVKDLYNTHFARKVTKPDISTEEIDSRPHSPIISKKPSDTGLNSVHIEPEKSTDNPSINPILEDTNSHAVSKRE